MESRAKVAGHALHPVLITFPLGLLPTSVLFDVIHLVTGVPRWAEIAFWMMLSGTIGGIAAAVPGTIDWLAIPRGTRAFRIGLFHGVGNVIVLLLFGTSILLRYASPEQPTTTASLLSLVGTTIAVVTGWLGGELIERLGVGVHDRAGLNAPSSLSS